jgi:hypothetical protein
MSHHTSNLITHTMASKLFSLVLFGSIITLPSCEKSPKDLGGTYEGTKYYTYTVNGENQGSSSSNLELVVHELPNGFAVYNEPFDKWLYFKNNKSIEWDTNLTVQEACLWKNEYHFSIEYDGGKLSYLDIRKAVVCEGTPDEAFLTYTNEAILYKKE